MHVTLVQPGNIVTEFTAQPRVRRGGSGAAAYAAAMRKAVSLMERDEANGAPGGAGRGHDSARAVGRRPPRRVSVGKAAERAGLVAKRVLPFRVFEAAAKGSLGVD